MKLCGHLAPWLRGLRRHAFSGCNTSGDQQGSQPQRNPGLTPAAGTKHGPLRAQPPGSGGHCHGVTSPGSWLFFGQAPVLRALHRQAPHLCSPCLCSQQPLLLPFLVIRPWASVLTSLRLRPLCGKGGTRITCCEDAARLCTDEPGGPAALGAGVSRVLLTRRAGAPATGPDTQSRQIGQQPLEVEGGQRRVRVLGGLLQPGTGRGAKQKLRLEAGDAKTPPAPWLRGFRHQEPGGRRGLSDHGDHPAP